jgi:hypothetical protein
MIRPTAALFLLLGAVAARGQSLQGNPVADAARGIGSGGLKEGAAPAKSPTAFKGDGTRRAVAGFAKQVGEDKEQRKAYKEVFLKLIENYEGSVAQGGTANDVSGALAFSVAVVYAAAKGSDLDDVAYLALIPRLQATLDVEAVRKSSDAQKQECYEWALCAAGTVLAMAQLAETEEAKASVKKLAQTQLENLLGPGAQRLVLKGKEIVLKPAGGLADGFTFTAPDGWKTEGPWYFRRKEDSSAFRTALIRFPPSIEAGKDIGASLRELWMTTVPAELAGRHSTMVYRRFVGDGLVAHFVFGYGREKNKVADSLFTLALVDLGAQWQPVIVAQTYEDPTTPTESIVKMMGSLSFSETSGFAEEFLATLRCPAGKGRPFITKEALVGSYGYGSGSSLQWENIYTGATTMTVVSYGGTLDLKADGTFDYTFSGASGEVGSLRVASDKDKGTWTVEGDLLIAKGEVREHKYRIAGVTQFADGTKVAVLFLRMDLLVNACTGGDSSDWYSTKKK